MTNADSIRAMTDEQLATLISATWHHTDYDGDDWDPNILSWLKSEDEDEHN